MMKLVILELVLGFPLDCQSQDFTKAVVTPFGRLLRWFEGPNKSRVLVQCLVLSPDRVPRSLVVSQGTLLVGNGRSWSVPTYLLDGQFPDDFPPDEDPVPDNGIPHPLNGVVDNINPNVVQGWQDNLAGAAPDIQVDASVNGNQMGDIQGELAQPDQLADNNNVADAWADWIDQDVNLAEQQADNEDVLMQDVQQHEISFEQSGSTAQYLRAHGPDITLNIDDVLAGKVAGSSSSSEEISSLGTGSNVQLPLQLQNLERIAFDKLNAPTVSP